MRVAKPISKDPHWILANAHEVLSPEVRDAEWESNCAGEIFAKESDEKSTRIGHFQGDAKLASFAVAAHALGQRGGLVLREGGQVAVPKALGSDKLHGAWLEAHKSLSPDVQKANWVPGPDGEVFAKKNSKSLQIGTFQGDVLLAAFVSKAHDAVVGLA